MHYCSWRNGVILWIVFQCVCLWLVSASPMKRNDGVDCTLKQNCGECITADGCGWCASSSKCLNETNGVPITPCDIWLGKACEGEDECRDIGTDCFSCVNNTKCGWCDNQVCLLGTQEGPFNASCESWWYGKDNCKMRCKDYDNCLACRQNGPNNCGWCADDNSTCMEGSSSGPRNGSCSNWIWSNQCEVIVHCERHASCEECIADASDTCGWCAATNKCMDKQDGKTTCADFKTETCADSCADFSANCTHCLSNANCGWCSAKGTTIPCVAGNAEGPLYTECPDDDWSIETCPSFDSCTLNTNCTSCIEQDHCGWCDYKNTSFCVKSTDSEDCPGRWISYQCADPLLACDSELTCESCISFPQCVWCEDGCREVAEVGTSCHFSCTDSGFSVSTGVIVGICLTSVVVIGLAAFIWYKVYWTKRHYYERLR